MRGFGTTARQESAALTTERGAVVPATLASSSNGKAGVTIVVPCFNEEPALPFLRNKLRDVKEYLEKKYTVFLILTDDGSTDDTWRVMLKLFGDEPNCTLVREPTNLGVAAAILTGVRRAETEVVCSIDCDCTYDPLELSKLLPMLTPGVDLVTGSPYHPLGTVVDVPPWRLALSRAASSLYRRVLRHKLYTYTSCFRVYRRSAILNLNLERDGFLGITELIAKLDLGGSTIVECPTSLEARVRGTSKMKIVQVLLGHIFLLCQLVAIKWQQKFFDHGPLELGPNEADKTRGVTNDWAQY